MKKSKYLIAVIILVAMLAFPTMATESLFNLAGNGARAAGMGYAFTGVADDATAISWNAAGLTQLYSMEASVVARFGFGSYDINDLAYVTGADYASSFQLNFISFVVPFSVGRFNIVGGVAYRTIYDFNEELTIKTDLGDYVSENDGAVNAISPSVGFQLNDMLSFGATANIYMGSYQNKEKYIDGTDDTGPKSDYSGVSFDIGVLLRPSSRFSIGANLNLPNTLKEDTENRDEVFEYDVPFFYSIGASFRATDQFLIAFDYFSRPWSNSDTYSDSYNKDIYNLNSFHAGLEYLITGGNIIIPIRLGWFTNPLFGVKDLNKDQVVDNVFTVGLGIVMSKFVLDAAFEYEPSSQEGEDRYGNRFTIDQNLYRMTIGATFHFGKD